MFAQFTDSLNLASRITPRRWPNLARIYSSYYLCRFTGTPVHRGNPFTVSIEPTTSCNLKCPECPSGLRNFTRDTGNITLETYRKIIDQLAPDLFYLNLYFQGEPYLNPLFFQLVEYAVKKKIYTATSTNAQFLQDLNARKTIESGLDRIIISLDGLDQATYEQYRTGGSIGKVLDGIRNLVKWKKELHSRTPYIILQFIVFRTNEHQVPELRHLAKDLDVDKLELKTAQLYHYEEGNPLMPLNASFSRYKKKNADYVLNNPLPDHCFRMWRGCVITWDGLVVSCCFDKDAAHRLGDLKEQGFKDIWHGAVYREFRRKVFSARKEIDICKNCTER